MSDNNLDKWLEELQKEIIDQEIEKYNKYIVELIQKPKNWGKPPLEQINVWYAYEGSCGDTMQFFLKIKDNIIKKICFITDGCGATVAAGSQTTLLVEGKNIQFAEKLLPDDIEKALGGLPDDHKHCAELATRTLKKAIEKYKSYAQRKQNH
ncbi:MAG: iron-sulfur cluster assembly scaffold protein [Promethearchaeota archaeon]